jgi:hypothetical protein
MLSTFWSTIDSMKEKCLLIFLALVFSFTNAQIPNSGFENWTIWEVMIILSDGSLIFFAISM